MNRPETKGTPDWIADVREFQKCFKPYFPQLAGDFGAAEIEMGWLCNSFFGNSQETVRRAEALHAVQKFNSLIREMANLGLAGIGRAVFELLILEKGLAAKFAAQSDGYHVEERSTQISDAERRIVESINAIQEIADRDILSPALDSLCSRMERGIAALPERRNINWEAVHAVDRLRTLWWRNRGKKAPRSLNPATNFATFLRDGFDYLQIKGDTVSAFKRWADLNSG